MKKNILIIAVSIVSLLMLSSVNSYAAEAGKIMTLKKDVSVISGDEKSEAVPQQALMAGDAVETGRKSRAKILFKDDSILNLGELSRVEVQEYLQNSSSDRSKSIYNLIDGSIRVVVGRSDLEIHTSTAVAAARGTSFDIWSEGEGKTLKTCSKVLGGQVLFKNKDGEIKKVITAKKGDTCCIPLGGPPRIERPGLPKSPNKPPQARPLEIPMGKQGDFERIDGGEGGEG